MLFRYFKVQHLRSIYNLHFVFMRQVNERKSMAQQLYEMLKLAVVTRYWPHNYYKYRGYDKTVDLPGIFPYIPGRLFDTLREDIINEQHLIPMVENKYLFNRILRGAGLPVTEVLGRLDRKGTCFDSENAAVAPQCFLSRLEPPFIIKPEQGSAQGMGVKVVEANPARPGSFIIDGQPMERQQLGKYLVDSSSAIDRDILFEKRVRQHPELERMYPDSTNTVRIDTLRTVGGDVLAIGAALRLGRGGQRVDNWYSWKGGLGIPVDIRSGTLGKVGYTYFLDRCKSHPDTGFVFEGACIPYWKELIETVRKAATIFPGINSIGWDVTITATGPLIIEGNSDYSLQFSQVCSGPYYLKPDFLNAVREYIQRSAYRKRYEKYFCSEYCARLTSLSEVTTTEAAAVF